MNDPHAHSRAEAPPNPTSSRHRERGAALILVLVLAAVFLLLGASLLSSSLNSGRIAGNEQSSARAFAIAEAGIDRTRIEFANAIIPTIPTGGWVVFANQPLDSGSYNVVATNNIPTRFPIGDIPADPGGATTDTDKILVFNSTGTLGAASRRIEVILQIKPSPFLYAVWSGTSQKYTGSSYTDSWNSNLGDFATTHSSTGGNVFSNGSIDMKGGSTIYGNAEVGGTIDSSHVQNGTVTTGAPAQTMPNPSCPTYTPAAEVCSGGGITYDPAVGDLIVSGTNCDIAPPPSTLSFRSIKLTGGGTLTMTGSSTHLDVFVAKSLDISGGAVINLSGVPGLLNFSACGPDTDDFKLTGGTDAAFTIYAPTRNVTFGSGGPFYGAIVSNTFDSGGSTEIHYDSALAGGRVEMLPGTWAEVYQ